MKTLLLILALVLFPLTVHAAETTLHVSNIQDEDIDLSDVTLSDFTNDVGYIQGGHEHHMVDGVRSFDWYNPVVGIQPIPPYPIPVDVYKVSVRVYGGTYLTGCLMKCDGDGKNCVNMYTPTRYNNGTKVVITNFTDGHLPADVDWAFNTTAKSGTVRVGGAIYFNETVE